MFKSWFPALKIASIIVTSGIVVLLIIRKIYEHTNVFCFIITEAHLWNYYFYRRMNTKYCNQKVHKCKDFAFCLLATTLTHLRYFFASHFFNFEYFFIIPKNLKRKCSRRSKTPSNIKNGWKLAKLSRKNRWVAVKFVNTV